MPIANVKIDEKFSFKHTSIINQSRNEKDRNFRRKEERFEGKKLASVKTTIKETNIKITVVTSGVDKIFVIISQN